MATGGMAGKIGRVTLWPFAFSATRATVSQRHQRNPLKWVGVSGENGAGDTNRAPIAMPIQFTMQPGTQSTINVRARAYDPDGDTMSIIGTPVPSVGTASVVNGDIQRNVPVSFTGEQQIPFTLGDGSAKRSSSICYGTLPETNPSWWHFDDLRANRRTPASYGSKRRRSGGGYWENDYTRYNRLVGYSDGHNGAHKAEGDPNQATVTAITGGPLSLTTDEPAADSYLDWRGTSTRWVRHWNTFPAYGIQSWTMNLFPRNLIGANETVGIPASTFTAYINGDYHDEYVRFGKRLKWIINNNRWTIGGNAMSNPLSKPANKIFLRIEHENNQTSGRRVTATLKGQYVLAMDQIIRDIREGLGTAAGAGNYGRNDGTGVHFVHAPAHTGQVEDLGSYLSWCPTECDVVSSSYHPTKEITGRGDATTVNNVNTVWGYTYRTNSTNHYTPEVLRIASLDTVVTAAFPNGKYPNGRPMMFPEWNAQNIDRYNEKTNVHTYFCCRYANDVNQVFNDFLNTHADRIVIDLVFEPTAITKGAYKNPSTAAAEREGSRQWDLGVDTYIAEWGTNLGAVKEPPA